MKKCWELYKKYEEIVNYLIVGGIGTVVNILIKWVLLFTVFDAENARELQYAIIIAWIFSIIFAYVTNKLFVFKNKNEHLIKEIMSFLSARILTLFLDMFIMWFFVTLLELNSDIWVLIWTLVSQVLVIVLNYVFSKLFIFKDDGDAKKKIIFFAHDLNIGGIEKSLINLLNNLDKLYDITLVLEKDEGTLKKDLSKDVKIIEYKVSALQCVPVRKIINYTRRLLFLSKHKNRYAFSCAYATYLYSASILSKKCSANSALYVHNDYSHIYDQKGMKEFFDSRNVQNFHRIIFVANESRDNFLKEYPSLKDKTLVINNIINVEEILEKSSVPSEIEVAPKDIVFTFVGRLDEHQKKISRLLETFKILIAKNSNIKLWIVGGGEEYDRAKDFIAKNELSKNILLLGMQSNPYKYMNASSYIVMTSDYEGFPVVYNEANILGKPMLTTLDITDDYYRVEDKRGFIISKEPQAMAKDIEKIMAKKIKLDKIDYSKLNAKRVQMICEVIEDEI